MIWRRLADIILKNRGLLLGVVALITIFMGYQASQIRINYNAGKVLPVNDASYLHYMQFKKIFGEDANAMVMGIKTPKLFDQQTFNAWSQLRDRLAHVKGVNNVLSIANLYNLHKDTLLHKFTIAPLTSGLLKSAAAADSVKRQIANLPFYQGVILTKDGRTTLMAINFDKQFINSPKRTTILKNVLKQADLFEQQTGIKVHTSGLPLIRTIVAGLISHEFILFLVLSLGITIVILIFFFRSFYAVIFPVIVVLLGVSWSLGLLVIMHYNITILTGIIPPLIIIIGIPNSIFILNKYYHEYPAIANKMQALRVVIEKISITTFIANVTTAIGFAVLCFTNSQLLTEFGLVASVSIMATFLLSLILIPIIFSYLPPPVARQTGIRDRKFLKNLLAGIDGIVHNYRPAIFVTTIILVLICLYGMTRINVNGYVVDDLPAENTVLADMKFFESNFNGVLPMEVMIDTKRKNGLMNQPTIKKIDKLEKLISSYPQFSHSISLVQALKFSTQAFYGGDKKYYRLPEGLEQNFILSYAGNANKSSNLMRSFIDSNKQYARLSFEMVDMGSKKMNELLAELQPRVDSIFNPAKYHVELTGSSVIFLKGTNYMVKNLYESLALAIVLIAVVMWILFRGIRMIAISLLPNLIPLVITAGMMGFFGIPLKPSTILIFSVAMGISSDQTIYFLTRYRQELLHTSKSISQIVSDTIRETGISMIYIATILFFGFAIFAASTFGGTQAFGLLLSGTLLVAVISNLILLPAFLLSIQKSVQRRETGEPVADVQPQNL